MQVNPKKIINSLKKKLSFNKEEQIGNFFKKGKSELKRRGPAIKGGRTEKLNDKSMAMC